MTSRRTYLTALGVGAVGLAGCASFEEGGTETGGSAGTTALPATGTTRTATATGTTEASTAELTLRSDAFEAEGSIPVRYTCDGADVSPPLSVAGVPAETASLALVVDDPDAPTDRPFVHWLLWNLPPDTTVIPAAVPATETVADLGGAVQGRNGFGDLGYGGPCPPADDGPHTYRFVLRAVDRTLDVDAGARAADLDRALSSGVLGRATFTAQYDR